ncbi:hypothetical protein WISP_04846 [Willisornis vidua]|uniref:Uncharacterized protein n=1 Tax=Willisornis vidua TaxID=1566151 RepID=A0ABQ9DUG8_9PASS|nr:hypothetical protein WISP_04846 [Willisornis vidua]
MENSMAKGSTDLLSQQLLEGWMQHMELIAGREKENIHELTQKNILHPSPHRLQTWAMPTASFTCTIEDQAGTSVSARFGQHKLTGTTTQLPTVAARARDGHNLPMDQVEPRVRKRSDVRQKCFDEGMKFILKKVTEKGRCHRNHQERASKSGAFVGCIAMIPRRKAEEDE